MRKEMRGEVTNLLLSKNDEESILQPFLGQCKLQNLIHVIELYSFIQVISTHIE